MEGLAVLFFPVLLMFFALSMERVEARLRRLTVEEEDVEQFFDKASNEEVNTFVREGLPRALDVLRLRRHIGKHSDSSSITGPPR
ncbi:MAG: hypothetical protein ABI251_01855 [Mycobacteriaceae bacterium]